jgi:hypothetical protein
MEEMKKLREMTGEDLDEEMEEIEYDKFMDDEDDFDNDYGVEEESEEETENKTSQSTDTNDNSEVTEEEDLESKTQRAFNNRLSELADTETVVQNFVPKIEGTRDPIIPFKEILSQLRAAKPSMEERWTLSYGPEWTSQRVSKQREDLVTFKTESMRVVNYLVKEFEMKKSATEYKRITTAKSGDLDLRKLYAHTLTDDIFKKLDILPEDKNHGMIFLLDWSGSMANVMPDTIKQIINLAMFCQRIQIPYQVFAFTTGYRELDWRQLRSNNENADVNYSGFSDSSYNLFEFFNNKMTNSEFNSMIELLHASPWQYSRDFDLNSTPLNEALVYMCDYIGKYVKNNSIEKMSLITLTDGEGHALDGATRRVRDYGYFGETAKASKVKNYIRDPKTKKEYPFSMYGPEQTRTFLRVIKDRYNIKTIGFHVAHNSRRDISCFVKSNVAGLTNSEQFYKVEQIRKDIRQNDYAVIENTGRDEMYLLPVSKQKIEDGELELKSSMNAKAIAKQFSKYLGVKKSSRVVLSRFVSLVA